MIFSKKKRPKKPGIYWVCDNDPGDGDGDTMMPRIVKLVRYGRNDLTQDGMQLPPYGMKDKFQTALWGDKIETPTVETEAALTAKKGNEE